MAFQTLTRRILLTLSLAAATTLVAPAKAQQVSTDFDHAANFSSYHTFSFYRIQTANPLFEQRVRDTITRDLQARGWQLVPQDGDVAITAIGQVQNTQEYNTFYDGLGGGFGRRGWGGGGFGGFGDSTTTSQTIPVGTLMVDLYDTHTKNLVFRGRSTQDVDSKNSDKNIGKVNKSIDKMFKNFPPHSNT